MPSESKPLLAAQTEKPNHYKYLKEFRVEQCPSFLQHKCTQHRPFTCFHWHFNNQRRRRPVRKRDGTFNYSADNYCTKYNETSGICEDGDEDKRRSPRKYKYRSTPCPNVKHGEEWGEPSNCEAGDACGYCHTRTEQQFHPEIYKSTKCNDVQQAGYCPRGLFCAFAHVEPEELGARELAGALDCGTSLAELLSSALPPDKKAERAASPAPPLPLALAPVSNGSGDGSECASTSSGGSAGRALRHEDHKPAPPPAWPARAPFDAGVLHDVVGNALDDLHLDEPLNLVAALDRDLADGEGLLASSAPVNIPQARPTLRGFSPPPAGSPLPSFLRYSNETERLFNSHAMKAGSFGGGGGAFEYAAASPSAPGELSRLREEVVASRQAVARWDERLAQARSACEAWQREADEAARAAALAERQRDDARAAALALRRELEAARAALAPRRELRGLPLTALKALQAQARAELEDIEKVLYLETATKCMGCEEQPRSVTLAPCNHYVLCETCAATAAECPYCQTPVQHHQ
ncbi:putative E3 ubiquitin-protein ligase UNKL [Spodoptera litura]|uniref:E3 ubiquitin-protein ligase UNKL n=1 Tax=Spodoptera litura TaxID=69820 RepID=A0A9J7ELU7_SPOLT|nr:putative E3 ubiquitin-protein ligase UNKL [Spodoptera litura]